MSYRLAYICALSLVFTALAPLGTGAQVFDTDVIYTTDADFDLGNLVSVNHDDPLGDQLQLDSPTEPFPFINVAASGRGTVVRVNTETGEVVGEYRTAPAEYGLDPSRTTVDLFGNVWTANRGEVGEIDGVPHGSAVKIGLLVGGTRVDVTGTPDPDGGYVAPPFGYNTCSDRDGDGLIRTSSGLFDVLAWPDNTDGLGGLDGLVQDAADECILVYQRLANAEQARHVSVDADNNVWVGGYPFELRFFYKLDGSTGAILDSFNADDIGCGGYGGLVDGNGVLWSIGWGWGEGPLMRYDPATGDGICVNTYGGYGLGIDTNGYLWASIWENGIAKVSPDGVLETGFPKSTYSAPSSMTGSATPLFPEFKPELRSMRLALQADPPPTFWVAPLEDWVASQSPWTPGASVSLTIEDGGGVVYGDSQITDGDGNFHFGLWDVFDVQVGHLVTVSDGTTTATHTVTGLFVDGVGVTEDTVFGWAEAGSVVDVWVHEGGEVTVTADGSNNWVADFSAQLDLTYLSDGGSAQYDDSGNATAVWWTAPRFHVAPDDNWIQSSGTWTHGETVTLTIEEGGVEVYSDSRVVGERGWEFVLDGVFDLQRGHVVTVTDGFDTKTHTVTDLFVDRVDVSTDTVVGRAEAGSEVIVWAHEVGEVTVTADGSNNWVADFSAQLDLTFQSGGGSQQFDDDGDATGDWWSTPAIIVSPDDDSVGTDRPWTPASTISLIIEDAGGAELYTASQTADSSGNFGFQLGETFDIQRGQVVTVSDGSTTKTHTVIDLYVDGVDVAADTVFGRTTPLAMLDLWVDGEPGVVATADSSGNWLADFAGLADVTYASTGGTQQGDDDGDATHVRWALPSFQVAPDDNWVQANERWTPGATITVTIEDGSGVVYSATQIADGNGWFSFGFGESFDLQRGHVVTVSDGVTTKTHTVIPLFVDGVDVQGDVVYGRGQADTDVDVWVHDDGGATVTADGQGNWSADFSGQTDLTYASDGGSQQADEDGDSTGVWWASPTFQAQPDNDYIGTWNRWPADTPLSVVIDADDDPTNGTLYTTSTTTDGNGNIDLGLRGSFNIERGHYVTVSDGATTKVHQVLDLYITDIDFNVDIVRGTAEPFSEVEVQVGGEGGWRLVTADGSGAWEADFSVATGEGDTVVDLRFESHVSAYQHDDDRDVTWVDWQEPVFRANPDTEQIWGSGWDPDGSVTIRVHDDDPATPALYEVAASINQWGDLEVTQWDFDLLVGHEVTVDDGATTKSLVLIDLGEPTIDSDDDVITGTATPGATVEVSVSGLLEGSTRWVLADEISGFWTADFSSEEQGQPAVDITEQSFIDVAELDHDGDGTFGRFGPPIQANRGVAVTPIDNHIWVANSGTGTVTRLDNDGNVLAIIGTDGVEPTGVAVDAAGKVWITNQFSDTTVRIDPSRGTDGLGEVDLAVELGEGAGPYNYSDMTGAVVVGSTSPQGIWTVIQDSGEDDFEWGRLTWNTEPQAFEPPGTEIVVEVRTSNSEAGLGGAAFEPVVNGELFSSFGRFIEVRVTLKASSGGESPVLSDIRVQPAIIEVGLDIKPGSYPNSINVNRSTGVIPVAVLGSADFDVLEIDVSTLRFGPALAAPDHELLDPATFLDHLEDVNGDGFVDLVSHYQVGETGLAPGDTEAYLIGVTLTGVPIEGVDSVRIIGKTK